MDIIISGIIERVLEPQTGVSKSTGKNWVKQDFLLQYNTGNFTKHVCFSVIGEERLQKFALKQGEFVSVFINIDSREYNGRFYNTIDAWRVERTQQQAGYSPNAQMGNMPAYQQPYAQQQGQAVFPSPNYPTSGNVPF